MATTKRAAALESKLLTTKNLETSQALDDLTPELRAALEDLVQEKLRGGRETAGHRSKTLSLKVDPDLYVRLKRARFETDLSGQDIMFEGLKMWLKKNKF